MNNTNMVSQISPTSSVYNVKIQRKESSPGKNDSHSFQVTTQDVQENIKQVNHNQKKVAESLEKNFLSEKYGRLATLFGGMWGLSELVNGIVKLSMAKSNRMSNFINKSRRRINMVTLILPAISSLIAGASALFAVLHFMNSNIAEKEKSIKEQISKIIGHPQ